MEMPLSNAQFSQAQSVEPDPVPAENVERELLERALGNPILLRIPTLIPLLVIVVAAVDTDFKSYLWWLAGTQILVGIFTASTAYRVKRAIQKKQNNIRKTIAFWLFCEAISGIVWGLMMVPIAEAGSVGMAVTVIHVTITVTLTAAAIATASANGLAQSLLAGFMLITVPSALYYHAEIGLYGVLSTLFFPPTLLWIGMLVRRQNRGALKVEMENESLSAQLAESLRVSQYLSKRDNLTGLLNRNEFKRVANELHQHHFGEGAAIIAVDLDHFKLVNDEHGHAVGDQALIAAARLMQSKLRALDVSCGLDEAVARWGGEEFIVALTNSSVEKALIVAERIRSAFENHTDQNWPDGLKITGSFGVIAWEKDQTLDGAIARADKAMYEAKDSGRNRICAENPKMRGSLAA